MIFAFPYPKAAQGSMEQGSCLILLWLPIDGSTRAFELQRTTPVDSLREIIVVFRLEKLSNIRPT